MVLKEQPLRKPGHPPYLPDDGVRELKKKLESRDRLLDSVKESEFKVLLHTTAIETARAANRNHLNVKEPSAHCVRKYMDLCGAHKVAGVNTQNSRRMEVSVKKRSKSSKATNRSWLTPEMPSA